MRQEQKRLEEEERVREAKRQEELRVQEAKRQEEERQREVRRQEEERRRQLEEQLRLAEEQKRQAEQERKQLEMERQRLKEKENKNMEIITCTFCLDPMIAPRLLQCSHTFCQEVITLLCVRGFSCLMCVTVFVSVAQNK